MVFIEVMESRAVAFDGMGLQLVCCRLVDVWFVLNALLSLMVWTACAVNCAGSPTLPLSSGWLLALSSRPWVGSLSLPCRVIKIQTKITAHQNERGGGGSGLHP